MIKLSYDRCVTLIATFVGIVVAILLCNYNIAVAKNNDSIITRIEGIEDNIIYLNERKSIDEVSYLFPDSVKVWYQDGRFEYKKAIWKCATGDYDDSKYFCYAFYPIIDGYSLENVEIPYIYISYGERLFDDELSRASEDDKKNAEKIMTYLSKTLGLSTSAACGVVANIYYESGCIADILEYGYTWERGGGYGICQWTNYPRTSQTGRRNDLVRFCNNRGGNYKEITSQLQYLEYELTGPYNGVLNKLKAVGTTANNENECYNAAYIWCTEFELPANAQNAGIVRGNFAKLLYKNYSENAVTTKSPKFTGFVYPKLVSLGRGYSVKGEICDSPTTISTVKVAIVSASGSTVCSKSAKPNSNRYDISALDNYITFDKLNSGLYYYKVTAKNNSKTYTLLNRDFVVAGKEPQLTMYNKPESNYTLGKSKIITGIVSSSDAITSITAGIYSSKNSKNYILGNTIGTSSYMFDLGEFNPYIKLENLSPNTYYYKVKAVNSSGEYTLINKAFTVLAKNPGKVTNLKQTASNTNSISISWSKKSGVKGYVVLKADSREGKYSEVKRISGYKNNKFTDKDVKKNRAYYYKVKAYVKTGDNLIFGKESAQLFARTKEYSTKKTRKVKISTSIYSGESEKYSKIVDVIKGEKVVIRNYVIDSYGKKWYYITYKEKAGFIKSDKLA